MSDKTRTSSEIEREQSEAVGEAEALQIKSRTEKLTPDEEARLEDRLNHAEALEADKHSARCAERLAQQKERLAQPTRPAPMVVTQPKTRIGSDFAEALQTHLRSFTDHADLSNEAHQRCRRSGIPLNKTSVSFGMDYSGLNFKDRTILATINAAAGAELTYKTYSQKVTEYITYFSPLVGMVSNEATSDANPRTYFKVDDTAMISTLTSASGGDEVTPTIPDTNIVTANVEIKVFPVTSGYQKVSQEELLDSAINLESKIAQAHANSDARFLEKNLLQGGGTTNLNGLLATATNSLGGSTTIAASAIDDDTLETMYAGIPQQYINQATWVASPAMASTLRKNLKDELGRPLFQRFVEDPVGITRLKGLPFVISSYMPAVSSGNKALLLSVLPFYQLRSVNLRRFDVLREKFYPHVAYAGLSWWGGDFLGPTGSNLYLKIT